MIKIIEKVLPEKTNLSIINNLIKAQHWYIAADNKDSEFNYQNIFSGKNHGGFSLHSYPCGSNELQKSNLNIYALIITNIVCEKLNIQKYNVNRFMWNYYLKGNQGTEHIDEARNDHLSILYSLNNTDGGIQIENTFYKDVMGEAKIFPSYLIHKGIGPNENVARFNLNAIIQI